MSKVRVGENDFGTLYPELAVEWHPTLNGSLLPCNVAAMSHKKVWWKCSKGHEWQTVIGTRAIGHGCPYCSGRLPIMGENDLATLRPDLAAEWHPTLNESLLPCDVTAMSNKKVWWKCYRGHEWPATIRHRFKGNSCPYCRGRLPIPRETDLATLRPELVAEWHPSLNEGISSCDVTVMSNKKVWWICTQKHEWRATISDRSFGRGCPYCSGRLPVLGKTDLATLRPDLATEWHPTLNENLLPCDVTTMSNKKVWWKCLKGHEWQAIVEDRSVGNGCPYCSGKLVVPGETDLTTIRPNLAAEWHPALNESLLPCNVAAMSNKKVWWKCLKGHEWQATVENRSSGNGCPYCAGKLPIPGETDLETLRPDLAREWHPTLNEGLLPCDVKARSHKRIWWMCSKGHVWQATVDKRSAGYGCPYCSGRLPIAGETDLETLRPDLTTEWHPTKNDGLSPREVTGRSGKKVWWRCAMGHEWKTTVETRTQGSGCPYCAGRIRYKQQ